MRSLWGPCSAEALPFHIFCLSFYPLLLHMKLQLWGKLHAHCKPLLLIDHFNKHLPLKNGFFAKFEHSSVLKALLVLTQLPDNLWVWKGKN